MNSLFLVHLAYATLFIVMVCSSLVLAAGVFIYDIKQINLQKRYRRHPYARAFRARPLVTIVLHVKEEPTKLLEDCLKSIAKNAYRNYAILIVSPNLSENINAKVKIFNKKYPNKQITVTENFNDYVSLNSSGDYLLFVDPGYLLDKHTIHNFVKHFALNPNLGVINLSLSVVSHYSVKELYRLFGGSLTEQWLKLKDSVGLRPNFTGIVYRSGVLNSGDFKKAAYVNSSQLFINPRSPHLVHPIASRAKKLFAILGRAMIFVGLSYFTYIALVHNYPVPLGGVWLYGVFLLAFGIMANGQLKASRKIRLILLAPMVCLVWFFVNFFRIFRLSPRSSAARFMG
jgi:glycosyltransferase involved in cell wall biosynthesis